MCAVSTSCESLAVLLYVVDRFVKLEYSLDHTPRLAIRSWPRVQGTPILPSLARSMRYSHTLPTYAETEVLAHVAKGYEGYE